MYPFLNLQSWIIELCQGVDKKALIAELQARGWLKAPGLDGKSTHNRRVDGKQGKFLVFFIDQIKKNEKVGVAGVAGAENVSDGELENKNPATPLLLPGVAGVVANDKTLLAPCDEETEEPPSDDGCDDRFSPSVTC